MQRNLILLHGQARNLSAKVISAVSLSNEEEGEWEKQGERRASATGQGEGFVWPSIG